MRRSGHRAAVLFLLTAGLFAYATPAPAQLWQWKTFTSTREVRQIAADEGGLWVATSGGLNRVTATGEISTYTNTEGLSSNDIRAVEVDDAGNVWLGLSSGLINVLDPATGQVHTISDYQGMEIYDFAEKGDSMYVALSLGVSLYRIDRNEVKETYKNLGAALPVEVPVRSLSVRRDTLWACTDFGLAYADLHLPNLQAPESWRNVTSTDGLPDDRTRQILWINGQPFVATEKGVGTFSGGRWHTFAFSEAYIVGLTAWRSKLVVALGYRVEVFDGTGWQAVGEDVSKCSFVTADRQGRLWIGRRQDGLAVFDEASQRWQDVQANCPSGNVITDLAIDENGILWCTSRDGGVFSYDGQNWTVYDARSGYMPINTILAVAVDRANRKWFGTQGRGAVVFAETDTGLVVVRHSEADGTLAGSDTPSYVIITDVAVDPDGNVWLLNRFASNGNAVAFMTPDGKWGYFSLVDGLKTTAVTTIAFGPAGRKWLGTDQDGVQVIDDAGTLFSKEDDDLSQGLTTTDGLRSNRVRAIAPDENGVVWIGTDKGLNFWYAGDVGERWGLISEDIYTIGVDPQNNKWIGTGSGITLLDPDGYPVRHFTTQNSHLVSDHVQAFAFDAATGDVYIGTSHGLSRLSTPYTAPKENLSEVLVYPNPYVLTAAGPKLTITNLARQSHVRILTEDGRLVRNFLPGEVPGGRVFWDGRNDRGKLVASGIYLVLVTTETGESAIRKVAVVR